MEFISVLFFDSDIYCRTPSKTVNEHIFAPFRDESDSTHTKTMEDIIAKADIDDGVNIQFTSGTTGKPKGAFLSHHNILNNASQMTTDERFPMGPDDTSKDKILNIFKLIFSSTCKCPYVSLLWMCSRLFTLFYSWRPFALSSANFQPDRVTQRNRHRIV